MTEPDWASEPDPEDLRRLHALLATDPAQAIAGLEALAGRGSTMSMMYLGTAFGGKYTTKDRTKAKHWYEQADRSGSALGAYMLGSMFEEDGQFEDAFEAYSRAASRGHLPSTYQLGSMHRDGLGTPKDLDRCRVRWEEASAKEHLFARRDLGTLYLKGIYGSELKLHGLRLVLSALWSFARLIPIAIKRGPIPEDRVYR